MGMTMSAAERLTSTAARLFEEKGLTRVGINEITREADVARMSLYNNFRSKEDLALAAYADMSRSRHDAIAEAAAGACSPADAVLTIFDLAEHLAEAPGFRGCIFINLAAHLDEADDRLVDLVRKHKRDLRERFEDLMRHHGASDPETLGRQLLALWDGALVDTFIEGSTAPIKAARAAATKLIGAYKPSRDRILHGGS